MKNINLKANIEFINDTESLGEAFAAVSLNPTFQWAKIVVTDDQPNANNHRIPQEEFDNVIRTGIFAPIKMTEGRISRGHDEAFGKPIGTIAQLNKVGNKIIALAAFWKKERPEDVELLKNMYNSGAAPNVSWELSYAEEKAEDRVQALYGISMNGLTFVTDPAYQGRTAIIAMASTLPDDAYLYVKDSVRYFPIKDSKGRYDINLLDEAIEICSSISEHPEYKLEEDEIKSLLSKANEIHNRVESSLMEKPIQEETVDKTEELEQKVTELSAEVTKLTETLSAKDKELIELQEYKAGIEKEKERSEKIEQIKKKFSDAKLEKDEEFWSAKAEMLLSLDEAALDFMIQELVSFQEASASTNGRVEIPDVKSKRAKELNPRDLGEALRSIKSKQ